MGNGSYSQDAHVAMTSARASAATEVFTQRNCHPLMNPHGVRFRECRDSEARNDRIRPTPHHVE